MSTAERSTPPLEPRSRDADETRYVPDELVEAFLITDPESIRNHKFERQTTGHDRRDEMWDGIYVVAPIQDIEHRRMAAGLLFAFASFQKEVDPGHLSFGGNISDSVEGWHKNYRIPDLLFYLSENPARNCETHWCGGPDLAVEILSEGDLARKKLDFYAKVNTRELLIVDRKPWSLEPYRLTEGRLVLVGVSTPDKPEPLTSEVLPLTFRWMPGDGRPTLELARLDGGQSWQI
jgi:Uma2 family endonuclease